MAPASLSPKVTWYISWSCQYVLQTLAQPSRLSCTRLSSLTASFDTMSDTEEPNFWDTISGPKNPNPTGGDLSFTLFGYAPSLAFAVVGLVAFALVSIPQLWYTIRRRGAHRTFHALMLAGCVSLCEWMSRTCELTPLTVDRSCWIWREDICDFQPV